MAKKDDYEKLLEEYFEHARKITIPMMANSRMSLLMLTKDDANPRPEACLELGAAVLLDKPILVCIEPGIRVPANIKRVATAIIEGNPTTDPDVEAKFKEALRGILSKDNRSH